MGRFLSDFVNIQELIYSNKITEAKNELTTLLNTLNDEYKSIKDPFEKAKRFKAIKKLIPALQDLKKNLVSDNVIKLLKLDAKLIKKPADSLETPVTPIIPTLTPMDEPKVEAPKVSPAPTPVAKPAEDKPKRQYNKPKNMNAQKLVPLYLDDYIGQTKAKETLKISIAAAKKENRVLNHLMICSSYGLGKTTLANIIANEMDMPFFSVNASNLKDAKSLSLYFSKISEPCIVFIDEIHTLKNDVQTILLSILTDFKVSFLDVDGNDAVYDLPPFTLIGATTQAGELLKPFINRFTILELVDYTDQEKEIIVYSKFQKLGYDITPEAKTEVARRSRGIPRTIETFAKGIRDIALTMDTKTVTEEIALKYFELYEIDPLGLTKSDLVVLRALSEATKPMGLVTLESKTGIQNEDIEFRNEPYLLKLGLMEKVSNGRIITPKGLAYLNGESIENIESFDEIIQDSTDEEIPNDETPTEDGGESEN